MFTNTKFIMLSILLAASNAAVTSVPTVTSIAGSSSVATSTFSYTTPSASTGGFGFSGGPSGNQNGVSGQSGSPFEGSFPSGQNGQSGQSGANGGQPNFSPFGAGGSSSSGFPTTGGQSGSSHGFGSGGSSSGGTSHIGGASPGGSSSSGSTGGGHFGSPFSRNVARQNSNQPFHSSGSQSQSSDITTADNSTFSPYIISYYTAPFDVRGLSTVQNTTQGQKLVEFIEVNGGQRNGDWWNVSTVDFVYHIRNYTYTLGGTVYNITLASSA